MKKALITGITGQDGAYLSKFLLSKGYHVYGLVTDFDRLQLDNLIILEVDDQIELVLGDLLNLQTLTDLLAEIRPDEIYNLAAQSSVARSFEYPVDTVAFNVLSAHHILDGIRTSKINTRFYQASSSEMFGRVKELPVTEDHVLHPMSPYAISKAAGHWLAINYREAYGLFCCCGVLFNHESFLRPSHFVTKKIISTAIRISKGSREKLYLGNVETQRDWGYAPEYVKSMWLMLQQDNPDDYVIATNEAHKLSEFVEISFSYFGLDWKEYTIIDKRLFRLSDIDVLYGNPDKAKTKIGWVYEMTFEEMVQKLIEDDLSHHISVSNISSELQE